MSEKRSAAGCVSSVAFSRLHRLQPHTAANNHHQQKRSCACALYAGLDSPLTRSSIAHSPIPRAASRRCLSVAVASSSPMQRLSSALRLTSACARTALPALRTASAAAIAAFPPRSCTAAAAAATPACRAFSSFSHSTPSDADLQQWNNFNTTGLKVRTRRMGAERGVGCCCEPRQQSSPLERL